MLCEPYESVPEWLFLVGVKVQYKDGNRVNPDGVSVFQLCLSGQRLHTESWSCLPA